MRNHTGGGVLRECVRGQRRRLVVASVLACGHLTGEALVPIIIGVLIDDAVGTGSVTSLLWWLLVLAATFVFLSSSFRFAARMAEQSAEQAGHHMRMLLSRRVLDPRGGLRALPGELTNTATSDAKRVGGVHGVLPSGVAALASLAVCATFLLATSVPLGLLVLLGTPPLLWAGHLIGRPLQRRSGTEQEQAARASGVAADLVRGLRILKGIGAEHAGIARYREHSRQSLEATLRAARARATHDGAVLTLTGLFIAVVALVGGGLAARGEISVGELIAAVGLAQFLLSPLGILAWVNGELAQARASAKRIASVLAAEPATHGGTAAPPDVPAGAVGFSGVWHGRLRGLDLQIAPGELVGVVAADPACGADLLSCLGREHDPDSGTVTLDGAALTELAPDRLRRAVVVSGHDAELFEGSVLACVDPTGTAQREHVDLALAAAAADEVAAGLPDGAHTVLAGRGESLSGGQRQRLALARALASDAPVLALHEPTTAVDAVTESTIAERLAALRRGRTTIVVASSPALLAVMDRVVMLDGTVNAQGEHAELARQRAEYRAAVLS